MKTEILSLILSRPNIRTVEIADRLDMDPESVRPHIADEIRRGTIVEEPVVAPNGRTVTSFRYADAKPQATVVTGAQASPFPARVLRALPPGERPIVERERPLSSRPVPPPPPAATDPLSLALSPAHVAPEHSDEPLEIDVPVTRKENVPLVAEVPAVFAATRTKPGSRVDKALECLRAADGKPVHVADLAAAMGIKTPQHPVSYLKTELAKGTVVRKGKDWMLGTAAVELPAPVVTPRDVPLSKSERAVLAKLPAKSAEPTAPTFPRADPVALAAYVPGSKRCTMNCGPHRDDPRSAAERALLCDECELVAPAATAAEFVAQADPEASVKVKSPAPREPDEAAAWIAAAEAEPVEQPAAQAQQAPAFEVPKFADIPAAPKWTPEAARAKVAARKQAEQDEQAAQYPAPALVELDPINAVRATELPALVEPAPLPPTVQAFDGLSMVTVPTGGLPNIKTPYLPPVAPGAPDISRNGLYENGEFRTPADEVLSFHSVGTRENLSETVDFERLAANDVRAGTVLTPPPAKFRAAVVSDGSLIIYVPDKAQQLDLTPEHARELYEFLQRMGYAAWPRAA